MCHILEQSDTYSRDIVFQRNGGYRKCCHECSLGVYLVIDYLEYAPSDALPLYAPSDALPLYAPSHALPLYAPSHALPLYAPSHALPLYAPSDALPLYAPSDSLPLYHLRSVRGMFHLVRFCYLSTTKVLFHQNYRHGIVACGTMHFVLLFPCGIKRIHDPCRGG